MSSISRSLSSHLVVERLDLRVVVPVFVLGRLEFAVESADFFVLGGEFLRSFGYKCLVFGDFLAVIGFQFGERVLEFANG